MLHANPTTHSADRPQGTYRSSSHGRRRERVAASRRSGRVAVELGRPGGLTRLIADLLADAAPARRVLLIVDQAEELLTRTRELARRRPVVGGCGGRRRWLVNDEGRATILPWARWTWWWKVNWRGCVVRWTGCGRRTPAWHGCWICVVRTPCRQRSSFLRLSRRRGWCLCRRRWRTNSPCTPTGST